MAEKEMPKDKKKQMIIVMLKRKGMKNKAEEKEEGEC